ncbi:MAG: BsaWI family type II restriction enzyme, partial [Methanosarcinales archaeon]
RASDEGLDLKQVRVSVAGKYFQALLAYIIADTASENGYRILLDPDLRKYDELQGTVVMLGDTALKPDADLVLYKPDDVMTPIAIFSCKTSLRERIHQSVMWKLLAELSFMKCEYSSTVEGCPVDKYKMDVEIDRDIILGFITMDWYNELANPQYKGISSIFDVIYTSNLNINLPNVRSIDLIFDDIRNDWTGIKT